MTLLERDGRETEPVRPGGARNSAPQRLRRRSGSPGSSCARYRSRLDRLEEWARAAARCAESPPRVGSANANLADAVANYFAEARAIIGELERWLAEAYSLGKGVGLAPVGAAAEFHLNRLSPAERRVFAEMAKGKPNKIIAYELSLTEATIKAHVSMILKKFNVYSRSRAIALFFQPAEMSDEEAARE